MRGSFQFGWMARTLSAVNALPGGHDDARRHRLIQPRWGLSKRLLIEERSWPMFCS